MRISDWSSDVCSSDLHGALLRGPAAPDAVRLSQGGRRLPGRVGGHGAGAVDAARSARGDADGSAQEPDRKSVVEGTSVSVRVDLGGRRISKKKNNTNDRKSTSH